ncbi:MAG: hypothetical protein D6786_02675 [Gammaproteobacteria bacterium]|nr:MAG: hypothetical protein D6786_02675 [Gammaproteobacteria bacterium]
MEPDRLQQAIALMDAFARRTGVEGEAPPRRYLWTDAFAVCNDLGLARATGEARFRERALRLIDQVHEVLGRHRPDDDRQGWLSGLPDDKAREHPTRGGLRIGKPLPERGPDEPFDERLEWERDGQYFHYLTKWMHALDQAARATGEVRYSRWARELAITAHRAFVYRRPGRAPKMYWKMSIDLTRPQVPSMGQHDPLDGYLTTLQLIATAHALGDAPQPELDAALKDYATMVAAGALETGDPLGLGGLLTDAYRLHQLRAQGASADPRLAARILEAAFAGLRYYAAAGELRQPAAYRLGFRELGLAIGLHAVARMRGEARETAATDPQERDLLEALARFLPLAREIEGFWLQEVNREAPTWTEHRDINEVMLATALAPDGFLRLR